MAGPLATGTPLATVNVNSVSADPTITVQSQGEHFTNLAAAEAAARSLAKGEEGDAAIVRDADGGYWVYRVDELAKRATRRLGDMGVRDLLRAMELPRGATLQAFFISGNSTGEGERVLTGTPQDGRVVNRGQQEQLAQLHRVLRDRTLVESLQDGVSVDELRQVLARLSPQAGWPAGHHGRQLKEIADKLRPRFEAALERMQRNGETSTSLAEITAGGSPAQTDNQVKAFLQAGSDVGVPDALMKRLRGEARSADLERVRAHLDKSLASGQLRGDQAAKARGLLSQVDAALAAMRRDKKESLPFDELASTVPQASVGSDEDARRLPSAERVARAWIQYPELKKPLAKALQDAIENLGDEVAVRHAQSQDARSLEHALRKLERARNLLRDGKPEEGMAILREMSGTAREAVALQPTDTAAHDIINSSTKALMTELQRSQPDVQSVTPPELQRMTRQYFEGVLDGSARLIHGAYDDPRTLVDFLGETVGARGRKNPDDLARAMYFYNAATWTVVRDVQNGTIKPQDFGRTSFSAVTPEDIRKLATARLRDQRFDLRGAVTGMHADGSWKKHPITIQQGGREIPLAPDNIDWTTTSLLTNERERAARVVAVARGKRGQTSIQRVLGGAEAVAAAPEDSVDNARRRAAIDTVHQLYQGITLRDGGEKPNASQAQALLVDVGELSVLDAGRSRLVTSKADAQKLVKEQGPDGKPRYDGVLELPTGQLLFKLKDTRALAKELKTKLDAGELAHLGEPTLAKLRDMVGPASDPGATLAARMDSEASSRYWRELASEAIQIAAVGVVSGGVGAAVGTGLVAARATSTAIKLARVLSQSASFTTLMGVSHGDFSAERYAKDALMFGVLSQAGKLAALANAIPGKSAGAAFSRWLGKQTLAIAAGSTAMVGADTLERLVKSGELSVKDIDRTLMMVTVLHGVNSGVAKVAPFLAPGAPERAVFDRMKGQIDGAKVEAQQKFNELESAIEAKDKPRIVAILRDMNALADRVDGLRNELRRFTERVAPELAPRLFAEVGVPNDTVGARGELTPHQLELQQAVATYFGNLAKIGLGPKVLAAGVTRVDPAAMTALMDAIRSPFVSLGTDNVGHLATVFEQALQRAAHAKGKPLTQAEVNRIFVETMATDIWMKGVAADRLADAPTAPTNAGSTGGEIHNQLKATAKDKLFNGRPVELTEDGETWLKTSGTPVRAPQIKAAIQKMVEGWIDGGSVPMSPDPIPIKGGGEIPGVKQHAAQAADALAKELKLDPQQAEALKTQMTKEVLALWGKRVMGEGHWSTVNGFMLGVWIHGIPPYSFIESVARSIPEKDLNGLTPQKLAEAVYAHHMAGFVAAGFARGNLKVNFEAMEAAGQLPKGAAARLTRLYDTSIQLAGKWRPRIDRGLTAAERDEYWRDAAPMRDAIDGLPEYAKSQLLSDDSGQFLATKGRTRLNPFGKWVGMQSAAKTNRVTMQGVMNAANQYMEEARARDSSEDPAKRAADFIAATDLGMRRWGAAINPETGVYEFAPAGSPAFAAHVAQLRANTKLLQEASKALDKPIGKITDSELVDWFRDKAPKDPELVTQLTQAI